MKQTILIHHRSADNFAMTPRETTEDERLSWNAKGILTYLLGKPPGWKTRVTDIVNHGKDGERAVRSGLKELRKFGYVQLVALRDNGKLVEWQWQVADIPLFQPDERNAHVENAQVRNSHLSYKESSKNDRSNNETRMMSKESAVRSEQADNVILPLWKPDSRTKEEKLRTIQNPRKIPSEREVNEFMEAEELDHILTHRDIYSDLANTKFHTWSEQRRRWVPIRDWQKFLIGLNETMEAAAKTRRQY